MSDVRVLIADDDPEIRRVIQAYLTQSGVTFDIAVDGRSALSAIGRSPPDILICDVDMPGGVEGFQVLEALRQHSKNAGTSVLMLTRHASRASMRLGMTLGADDYLTKPFTKAELTGAFDQLLRKHERHGHVAAHAVARHRWQGRAAYGVAVTALFTAGASLYQWHIASENLNVAQRKLDRAVSVADRRLPNLLSGARTLLSAVARTSPPPVTANDCRELIRRLADTVPAGGEVGWVGANGIVTCRTGSEHPGKSVEERPFFTRARDSGVFAPGNYSIDEVSGVPVLTSSFPLKSPAGAFLGVAYVSQDIRPSAQGRDVGEERDSAEANDIHSFPTRGCLRSA